MKFALLNPNWDFKGSTYFGCQDPHIPLELLFAADQVLPPGMKRCLLTRKQTISQSTKHAAAWMRSLPTFW